MGWSALTLVTDEDLGALEPETTAVARPLGATEWPDQRAEAKRDLKIWMELDFADVPGVADRVIDRWAPDYVFGYTGAAYTDYTSALIRKDHCVQLMKKLTVILHCLMEQILSFTTTLL